MSTTVGKTETSSLLPISTKSVGKFDAALDSGSKVSTILFLAQAIFIVLFLTGTKISDDGYSPAEYVAFRDIMAMLLLGFGYLMTFLKSYGLGAVGFTMMLTAYGMQLNVFVELWMRHLYHESENTSWPMPVTMATLIDAEFSAATLMITFGAVIGVATPLQLLILASSEAFFYAFNKVFLVLGLIAAEDVGGSMTIHMFGAYFGLAASFALGAPNEEEGGDGDPDKVSDVFALVGTTILWVFWPSFVGATETGVPENEKLCVINTIFALLASTGAAFWASHKLTGSKFDPVHVANSTLAGGVAIGSSGRLNIGPGGAALLGAIAGLVSVAGYVYSSPFLEKKFGIFDTCGVGNLHGLPSILGGLFSVYFVTVDPEAIFLSSGVHGQMLRQVCGVLVTLFVAICSGYCTGLVASKMKHESTPSYKDEAWWHAEYFDSEEED